MKKFLLLILLLGFFVDGYSQDNKSNDSIPSWNANEQKAPIIKGVKYGVRGGYNISNLDFEDVPTIENKHRNSIYFGAFAEISLSKYLSIAPELQFSAEGANDEALNLDYIQMPVLIQFRLSEKFRAGLGPQVGLKVHKFNDGMANMAYSALAGIEYKINYAIFVDARYTYGIRNVFDEASGISAKNTNIQLGIGYKF